MPLKTSSGRSNKVGQAQQEGAQGDLDVQAHHPRHRPRQYPDYPSLCVRLSVRSACPQCAVRSSQCVVRRWGMKFAQALMTRNANPRRAMNQNRRTARCGFAAMRPQGSRLRHWHSRPAHTRRRPAKGWEPSEWGQRTDRRNACLLLARQRTNRPAAPGS